MGFQDCFDKQGTHTSVYTQCGVEIGGVFVALESKTPIRVWVQGRCRPQQAGTCVLRATLHSLFYVILQIPLLPLGQEVVFLPFKEATYPTFARPYTFAPNYFFTWERKRTYSLISPNQFKHQNSFNE